MPGFSYDQIAEIFEKGGRVLGRAWGQPYCEHNGMACCPITSPKLMPDCSDFQIEAGFRPSVPTPTRRPQRRPRIIG